MLRFTIRDLFWLTLVIAMGVAWWVDHRRLAEYGEQQRDRAFTMQMLLRMIPGRGPGTGPYPD